MLAIAGIRWTDRSAKQGRGLRRTRVMPTRSRPTFSSLLSNRRNTTLPIQHLLDPFRSPLSLYDLGRFWQLGLEGVVELIASRRVLRRNQIRPFGLHLADRSRPDGRPGIVHRVFEGFSDSTAGSVFVDQHHPQEEHPQWVLARAAATPIGANRVVECAGDRPDERVVEAELAARVTAEPVVPSARPHRRLCQSNPMIAAAVSGVWHPNDSATSSIRPVACHTRQPAHARTEPGFTAGSVRSPASVRIRPSAPEAKGLHRSLGPARSVICDGSIRFPDVVEPTLESCAAPPSQACRACFDLLRA